MTNDNPQLRKYLEAEQQRKESNRERITEVLEIVATNYKDKNIATSEIYQGHDVHAFYRLTANPNQVVHVQGYPGLSNDDQMAVWARLMDYDKMIAIRKEGRVSIGNEHGAALKLFWEFGFGLGMRIPYRWERLELMLGQCVPELDLTKRSKSK